MVERIFRVKKSGGEESGRNRGLDADWCKEKVWLIADEIESDKPELIGSDRPLAREVINRHPRLAYETRKDNGEPLSKVFELKLTSVRNYLRERRNKF